METVYLMLRRRELRSTLYRNMSDVLCSIQCSSESSARGRRNTRDPVMRNPTTNRSKSQSAAAQHRLSYTLKVIMIGGTGPEVTNFDGSQRKMTIFGGKEHNTG